MCILFYLVVVSRFLHLFFCDGSVKDVNNKWYQKDFPTPLENDLDRQKMKIENLNENH